MEKGAGTAVGPPDWRSIVAQAFPPPTRNGGSSNGKHSAEDANPPREWLDGEQELLVQYSILPLGRNDGVVHMALADLNNAGLARCLARMQNASALIHLAPRPAIDAALAEAFREEDKHSVSWAHAQSRPDQSASRVLSTPQKIGGAPLIATVIAGLAFKPVETLVVLIAVL